MIPQTSTATRFGLQPFYATGLYFLISLFLGDLSDLKSIEEFGREF